MSDTIKFQFERPNDSPGYLLGQVTTLWQRKQKRVLDPLDLTHTQFVLMASLAWLSKTSHSVTQVDIARQSNADRMMVSKVLRTLENKGFITRHQHETDTRAKTIRLTSKGEKVLQSALKSVEDADRDFFAALESGLPAFNTHMVTLINENKTI